MTASLNYSMEFGNIYTLLLFLDIIFVFGEFICKIGDGFRFLTLNYFIAF